jgi:hypothetical protein
MTSLGAHCKHGGHSFGVWRSGSAHLLRALAGLCDNGAVTAEPYEASGGGGGDIHSCMICVVGLVWLMSKKRRRFSRGGNMIDDKSLSAYRARQGQGAGGAVDTEPSANATTREEELKRRSPSTGLSGVGWVLFLCHCDPSNLERQENAAGNWA